MNLHQLLQHSDRPFLSHPQVARYFPAASIEDARRRLGRSIERGEGPGVVFGASGTGKSMLLQVLAAQYHQRFDVVLLACAQMHTRRGLLQAIHFELGLDHQQRDEGELRLSLLDHLLTAESTSRALLLLVDEAQSLPTQLIEEIRILSNLASNGVPRVRVVLAGLPSLEERLAGPDLEPFNQRLAARCYVSPFARAETVRYVQAQVSICGADPERVFAADAWDALFNSTDGVPRLLNQLCDRAMVLADEHDASLVDGAVIQEAWADLQQLPSPPQVSNESGPRTSGQPAVVEFGGLLSDDLSGPAEFDGPDSANRLADHRQTIAYPIAIGAGSPRDESAGFAEPAPNRRRPTPILDEPQRPTSPVSNRRPRTHDDCVPVAADPFADQFDEEEIVLDRFSTLSEIFQAGTPYVENVRDRAFADRVEEALAESVSRSGTRNQDSLTSGSGTSRSINGGNPTDPSSERYRETIRLAVIGDAETFEQEPSPRPGIDAGDFEELVASKLAGAARVATSSSTDAVAPHALHPAQDKSSKSSPTAASKYHLSMSDATSRSSIDDPILLIEDEPIRTVRPQSGVRREAYRDLFSRLRHGT